MLNKKVFIELVTTEKEYIINDMLTIKSHKDVIIPGKIHVKLYINSNYKYETAICKSYELQTNDMNSFIDSMRGAIKEHGKQVTDNMLRHFNMSI